MSTFYSRYIPGQKPTVESDGTTEVSGNKRKRAENEGLKISKKRSREENKDVTQSTPAPTADSNILAKYSATSTAKKHDQDVEVRYRKKHEPKPVKLAHENDSEPAATGKTWKNKFKVDANGKTHQNGVESQDQELAADAQESDQLRHKSVLKKFDKAKEKNKLRKDDDNKPNVQEYENDPVPKLDVELHGLEPFPQPEEVEIPVVKPTYSTLPQWLAKPMHVPAEDPRDVDLSVLPISNVLKSNLEDKGIRKVFPIQKAVVPLLLEGSSNYDGDLAISAATGSGKTLAYVLPIIEALKDLVTTKLRAIVVVPTRELVKQAQEVFEYCAASTGIKVATALGSKLVKEEQDILVEEYDRYDPEEYKRQQESPMKWTTFSVSDLLRKARNQKIPSFNYITNYRSKVDVLICTPGRLVEHLRSTKGFNLDDVRWLVIDEVDRLLNESYQEWIEVVMPALESRAATVARDKILQHMKMDLPRRDLRKVILSATMTQDISKLNSLNLWRPKLIVLGAHLQTNLDHGEDGIERITEIVPDASGAFRLPETLSEFAVASGDGSNKPLYLLELFKSRLGKATVGNQSVHADSVEESSGNSSSEESSSALESSDENSSSSESTPPRVNGSKAAGTTRIASTLIFTRSTEAAARLSRLLSLLDPTLANQLAVLTKSTTSSSTSRKALRAFREGKISLLVTTDRASRGLDIPKIAHVISYDVPTSAQSYVHRVGRTARAGATGNAWTLLTYREAGWFWRVIGKGDGEETILRSDKVKRVNLDKLDDNKGLKERYENALKQLGDEVQQQ